MSYTNTKTPASERDEARTPLWLFKWLDNRYQFLVDAAATKENSLCEYHRNKCMDFDEDWLLAPVWCNPPYSELARWLKKGASECLLRKALSVFIIPALNGDSWSEVALERAAEIIHIVGRVNFLRPDGTEMSGNNRGTCVVIFDPLKHGTAHSWVRRDEIRKKFSA